MKTKFDAKEWAQEFEEFMSAPEVRPPGHATESILAFVRQELNPTFSKIMTKLALLHLGAGSLSLLVCSQFGMGRGFTLAHLFMQWGDLACMAACGAIFLGMTTVAATVVLTRPELKEIRKKAYSPILVLGLASLLVFFSFGAELVINYALAWLVGGVLAGIVFTEIGIGVRGSHSILNSIAS